MLRHRARIPMSGMMVLRTGRVECSAKIAMAALFNAPPAKRLLLDHDRSRSIFLRDPFT